MLFNSYAFIFLFLPVALLGYFVLGRRSDLAPVVWLTLASLVFYAFGGWQFVPLLLASIAFNYGVGYLLIARKLSHRARLAVLTAGVTGDLVVLAIFKYAGFFAANLNALFATGLIVNIVLPVGISFYTFPDRVSGRCLPGPRRALRAAALRAVRHILSAPDRRPDPAS